MNIEFGRTAASDAAAIQAAAMAGGEDGAFIAPPPFAVAHQLLRWWLDQ